jgi:hypothetical protein
MTSGTLDIEIGGTGAGLSYDQLRVLGIADLDGTVNLTLVGGFNPAVGSTYQIITYASRTGSFTAINGTSIPNNKTLAPTYNATDLTLTTTSPLLAAAGPPPADPPALLADAQLQAAFDAALSRWSLAGVDTTPLQGAQVQLADLDGDLLGLAGAGSIWIDRDAAGYGWFVDPTPWEDDEFAGAIGAEELLAVAGSNADGRMDLLTAVMHEIGMKPALLIASLRVATAYPTFNGRTKRLSFPPMKLWAVILLPKQKVNWMKL